MKPYRLTCAYFGTLPDYLFLLLESCRSVPDIDFLLLTDSPPSDLLTPPNVSFRALSLEGFCEQAQAALGLPVNVKDGYKINDFKPMFGEIFQSDFEGFEYWGFFDLDQVFTQSLVGFLDEGRGQSADIINTHSLWTHGPFMLLKNTAEMRTLFRKSRDWQDVVTEPRHRAFDECGQKYSAISKRSRAAVFSSPVEASFLDFTPEELLHIQDFDCFTTVICREVDAGRCRVFQQKVVREALGPRELLRIGPAEALDDLGRAWGGFHWVAEKPRRTFTYPTWETVPQEYYVTRFGFFDPGTPWLNRVLWLRRFLSASFRLVRDRLIFHLGKLGIGERPEGDFR